MDKLYKLIISIIALFFALSYSYLFYQYVKGKKDIVYPIKSDTVYVQRIDTVVINKVKPKYMYITKRDSIYFNTDTVKQNNDVSYAKFDTVVNKCDSISVTYYYPPYNLFDLYYSKCSFDTLIKTEYKVNKNELVWYVGATAVLSYILFKLIDK